LAGGVREVADRYWQTGRPPRWALLPPQKRGELKFAPTQRLRGKQALEGAACEAEEMVEQEGAKSDECSDDDGGGKGMNCCIHVSQTAKPSSPRLKIQLLNGSGLALTAARALAFVPCEVRATPPASNAAPKRHSGGAAPVAAKVSRAAAGGRMNV